MGIEALDPFELPLINTVILLSSGFTVTYGHHFLINGKRSKALYGLLYTVILATIFTALQGVEYSVSSFTISDGAFGSCFYFGTGLILAPIFEKYMYENKKKSNYSKVKAQNKNSNPINSTSNLNPN
jgi:cytochrome c oxidase subunit 3